MKYLQALLSTRFRVIKRTLCIMTMDYIPDDCTCCMYLDKCGVCQKYNKKAVNPDDLSNMFAEIEKPDCCNIGGQDGAVRNI